MVEIAIITVASLTVQEIFRVPHINIKTNTESLEDLEALSEDSDLVTQIDIDNRRNEINQKKRRIHEQLKEVRKEIMKEKFRIKEKWFSERGDIHTNVLVLGAYLQYFGKLREQLNNGEVTKKQMGDEMFKFAQTLFLNKKSVDEIINLCQQLQKIMNALSPDMNIDVFSIKPPTGKQLTLLQQLILVGFPENIAKKKEIFNSNGVDINLQRKRPQYE